MCGIMGYIGPKNVENELIKGLKKLEYRGYDSSGIALLSNNKPQIIKSIGKIKTLEDKVKSKKIIKCNKGIAHTRWATHGKVNTNNAHPHRIGNVTLVHNGIIENYKELKKELENDGIKFKSDTDTEVVCALINKFLDYKNIINSIEKALSKVKGTYALVILFDKDDSIYATCKDAPLVVGVNEDEFYISSDINAIDSKRYFYPDNFEIVKISNELKVYKDKKIINKKLNINTNNYINNDKGKYKHFMLKEIMEQDEVVNNIINRYINKEINFPDIEKYENIHIVGCGSALYAGCIGEELLIEKANINVNTYIASEYRYKNIKLDKKTLVILISQSGETADTIAALKKAKSKSIDTLALVNVAQSTIYRESKYKILLECGSEVAVATTKAYLAQATILSLLALKTSYDKKLITNNEYNNIIKEFKTIPKKLNKILNNNSLYKKIAKIIYKENNIYFIGRKIDFAMCLEGSLKLKEVSYIHSEAYQSGELKHGTISLIDKNSYLFSIITDSSIYDKSMSNLEEVKSRGGKIILITNKLNNKFKYEINVDKLSIFTQFILVVPILQQIAYNTACLKKNDVDKPKNLAKSVTVE